MSRVPVYPILLSIPLLALGACKQQDPALVNDLIVTSAEKERLKAELEKSHAEIQSLQQQLSEATKVAEQAVNEAKKGIDKKMVQNSFVEAVQELQGKVLEKYPDESVASYQIYDVNFPSENPISSSVSFTMKNSSGSERVLSFEGAANLDGVWNFAPVKDVVVKREPTVRAPATPPAARHNLWHQGVSPVSRRASRSAVAGGWSGSNGRIERSPRCSRTDRTLLPRTSMIQAPLPAMPPACHVPI